MRLRTKYATVLFVILLVLGTVVVGTAELFKRQTIQQEQSSLDQQTKTGAAQVDKSIGETHKQLAEYASSLQTQNSTQLNDSIRQLVDTSDFRWAAVVNSNQRVVAMQGEVTSTTRKRNLGKKVANTSLYFGSGNIRSTLRDGTKPISAPIPIGKWGSKKQAYSVTIAVEIIREKNETTREITGALVGAVVISEEDFFRAVKPLSVNKSKTPQPEVTARITGSLPNGTTATLYSGPEGKGKINSALTSSATIERTGWTLEVRRNRRALTDQIQLLQFIQFGSLVIVLLTVFGLGFYQYRTTLQQTDKLLTGFNQLTEGNFEHSLQLQAAQEWTQISDGFNTMAEGLKQREAAIKEREQQIRERERRLSVLNRLLRHNLQNDMTVIQGFAEVIPTAETEERRQEIADRIISKSTKLVNHGQKARNLEELMENAEDGPVRLDLARELREITSSYESEYPEFTVGTDIPEQAWASAIARSEAGIESIVENSFEHNDSDDPRVSVTVKTVDEEVLVRVRDNGPGIPEYEQEVLTQDEETSLEHGSGIGLWLAYWATVKSDGDLEFETPEEGGTVATLRFPATDAPPEEKRTEGLLAV